MQSFRKKAFVIKANFNLCLIYNKKESEIFLHLNFVQFEKKKMAISYLKNLEKIIISASNKFSNLQILYLILCFYHYT